MSRINVDYSRDALLSKVALATLQDRYMLPNEQSPQDAFARAAWAFSDNLAHAQRIYDYASKGWFMYSTPILANGGTERGMPIACFGGYVPDSRGGLLEHYAENAWLSSMGGGIGGYWGHVRSDGQKTSKGSKSTGSIPFIKVVDSQMLAFSQGSTRRGSYAAYTDVSHPEIEEFVNIRRPTGGDHNRKSLNLNNAVVIPDSFMRKITGEDEDVNWNLIDPNSKEVVKVVNAIELWRSILNTRVETGEPYIMFGDTVNAALPQALKDKGLHVYQSNLCVAPETPVLTSSGYQPIGELEGNNVEVWNGEEWSSVEIVKTGEDVRLITVTFSDGSSIDCTPYHKFYVQENYHGNPVEYRAADLYTGAKLEKFELPIDCGLGTLSKSPQEMYSQGFYSGDGIEGYEYSWVYPEKYKAMCMLVGEFNPPTSSGRITWRHGVMKPKDYVPFKHARDSRIFWLAGLLDADGCVIRSNNCDNIQLASIKPAFLHKVKLFLQEMGVSCSVSYRRDGGEYLLPKNDGTGESGEYSCQPLWLLNINGVGVRRLVDMGIKSACQRLQFQDTQEPNRDASKFVTVVSVSDNGREDSTYCFKELKRSRGMFNGILTGNCSEITLPTNKDRTFVCCLSSLNLEKWDEWKDSTIVEDVVRFLDNVLTWFIDNAPEPLSRAVYSASQERSIGLGAMGFHSLLQSKGIPFESALAVSLNLKIFKELHTRAVNESRLLARERGEAPDMVGTGMRNAHLFAIAPNATSSLIAGTSPGIEPYVANVFTQKTLSGSFSMKNPALVNVLEAHGMNTSEVWQSINQHSGSVQHLEFLSDYEKEVFKTAQEINQSWLVQHAADRQPYICQAQSLNLFFPPKKHEDGTYVDMQEVQKVHIEAWKKNLKTLYYVRSRTLAPVENVAVKVERKYIGGATPSPVYEETTCLACES